MRIEQQCRQSVSALCRGGMSATSVVWFRKGLRLHDNAALIKACKSGKHVNPIFILDPWFLKAEKVPRRAERPSPPLLETFVTPPSATACASDSSLRARKSRLIILRGKPKDVLPKIFKAWNVGQLCYEYVRAWSRESSACVGAVTSFVPTSCRQDTEPYAVARDQEMSAMACGLGIDVHACHGHTLFDPYKVAAKCGGKCSCRSLELFLISQPPLTYQSFLKLAEGPSFQPVPPPADIPDLIPPPSAPEGKLVEESSLPTLKELGYSQEASLQCKYVPEKRAKLSLLYPHQEEWFPGGETHAQKKLAAKIAQRDWICDFEKPKTTPACFLEPSTTGLSPYLKFGCLSPRLMYHELQKVYAAKGKHTKPPVSLVGQLYWREFFYANAATIPNYDKMVGNRICKQVPWDHNPEYIKAWEEGMAFCGAPWEKRRTGFPWIDAAMRQLKQHGWLHHLARHSVACFLTRGDLWCHWEEGAKGVVYAHQFCVVCNSLTIPIFVPVFDRDLVDADWSINNANWMWLSASAYFSQYFRVYGPSTFPQRYDKEGKYVRHFIPELRKMPTKYIYEPWTAPLAVQKQVGCVIGRDCKLCASPLSLNSTAS
eukprot:scaffold8094_cov376-Prasinococcus_capsulatus_cf.AAC.1